MLVVGDKEVAAATVSVRLRRDEQLSSRAVDDFKESIKKAIVERTGDLSL